MKQTTAGALLALACLVPRGHDAFTTSTHRPLATISSRSQPLRMLDDDIEELQKETDEALRAAKKAIEDVDKRMTQAELKRKQQAATATQAERLSDAVASGISGAAIGAVLGTLALIEFPVLAEDPLLPPLATSVLLGGAAFVTANTDNPASPVVRNSLGKGLKSLGEAAGNSIKGAVERAVASIAAIPGKLANAAEQKAKETAEEIAAIPGKLADAAEQKAKKTVEEIASIPGKVQEAASQKAKDTAEEIAAIPGKLADAAEKKVKETVEEIENSVKETVEEIERIPGKLTEAAEKKVQKTVEEIERIPGKLTKAAEMKVKETTKEIKELPVKLQVAANKKAKEVSEEFTQDIKEIEASIEQKVEQVVEEVKALPQEIAEEIKKDVSKVMTTAPKLPLPPKMPPSQEAQLPKPPKSEKPPELRVPKIELPKISLPMAELPKIPSPPKIPTPPKKAPPMKKEEDNFVFSEVSLKRFMQDMKSKEKTKDEDFAKKPEAFMEAKRKADEERKVAAEKAAAERMAKARADAEAKKKTAEEKRAEAERKEEERQEREEQLRREAEEKKAALLRAKQAQESVESAKPRSTFSLTSLFGISEDAGTTEPGAAAPSTSKAQPKKTMMAPPGVPIITGWKQNRDGSIMGRISGASGFKDGEKIETSPIAGTATSGSVVQTASGSR